MLFLSVTEGDLRQVTRELSRPKRSHHRWNYACICPGEPLPSQVENPNSIYFCFPPQQVKWSVCCSGMPPSTALASATDSSGLMFWPFFPRKFIHHLKGSVNLGSPLAVELGSFSVWKWSPCTLSRQAQTLVLSFWHLSITPASHFPLRLRMENPWF